MIERRAGGGARRAIGGRHGVAAAVGLALLAGAAAVVVLVQGREQPRTSVTRTGKRATVDGTSGECPQSSKEGLAMPDHDSVLKPIALKMR